MTRKRSEIGRRKTMRSSKWKERETTRKKDGEVKGRRVDCGRLGKRQCEGPVDVLMMDEDGHLL